MKDILLLLNEKIVEMKEIGSNTIKLTNKQLDDVKSNEIASKLVNLLGIDIDIELTLEEVLEEIIYEYNALDNNLDKQRCISRIIKTVNKYDKI